MESYQHMNYTEAVEAGELILKNWCIANFLLPGNFTFRLKKVARKEVIGMMKNGEGFDHSLPGYAVGRDMRDYMTKNLERYEAEIKR